MAIGLHTPRPGLGTSRSHQEEASMSVTVASRLERLVRFVPGVAGYQDRENSRTTDKQVRMRLVQEIGRLIQSLDDDKERLARSADLSRLPRLDRLAGRLERQSRIVEFASRGYTGLFDLHQVDEDTLDQLYAFDLGLFDALSVVRAKAEAVRAARADAAALETAIEHMMEVIEWFDQTGTGIVQRYPEGGSGDIKMGAQLVVRENQAAVFFRDGQGLDVFGPGRHTLSTQNLPILTRLLSLPWGFTSPFRAEVYFVNLKVFTNMRWGTRDPVKTFRLTKYTSARKGLVKPHSRESSRVRIGKFWVERVWRPGPKTSSPWPSRKNTAAWFSRTTSCAPILMSPEPPSG